MPTLAAASQRFAACVKLVLVSEGGNDDDPRDPGGRTSRGITQREWDAWVKAHPGLPSDVFQAPQDQVLAIYKAKYWDVLSCDDLPAGIDYAVFDYGVLSGVGRAARILQGFVGAAVDGEIGPETIAATAKADPTTLINQICDERLAFLQSLPTFPTFGKGWTNRVESVRAASLAMAAVSGPSVATAPDQIAQLILKGIAQMEIPMTKTGTSITTTQQNGAGAPSPLDLGALLQQVLSLSQTLNAPPAPPAGTTPAQTQDQMKQIVGLLNAILGAASGQNGVNPLGPVNGALGQTVGNLLNGNKSAIGIIGALATSLLQTLGPAIPSLPLVGSSAALGQIALPVFLAITAWGVLGKFEKWMQTAAPQAATA
jgi:lysozyme family protein